MHERSKRPRKAGRLIGVLDAADTPPRILSIRNAPSKLANRIAFLRRISGLGPLR